MKRSACKYVNSYARYTSNTYAKNFVKAIGWTGGPSHQQRGGATTAIQPSTTSDATCEDTTGVHGPSSNAPPTETAAPQQDFGDKTLESSTASPSDDVVVSEQAVASSAVNNSGTSPVSGQISGVMPTTSLRVKPPSRKDTDDEDLNAEATNVSTPGPGEPAVSAQNEQTEPPETPQIVFPISTERNERLWEKAAKHFVKLKLHVEGTRMQDVQREDMIQNILRSNRTPVPSTWGPNMRSGLCPLSLRFHGPYHRCGTWQNRARHFEHRRYLETNVSQNPIFKSD